MLIWNKNFECLSDLQLVCSKHSCWGHSRVSPTHNNIVHTSRWSRYILAHSLFFASPPPMPTSLTLSPRSVIPVSPSPSPSRSWAVSTPPRCRILYIAYIRSNMYEARAWDTVLVLAIAMANGIKPNRRPPVQTIGSCGGEPFFMPEHIVCKRRILVVLCCCVWSKTVFNCAFTQMEIGHVGFLSTRYGIRRYRSVFYLSALCHALPLQAQEGSPRLFHIILRFAEDMGFRISVVDG